jgi:hypothetical protein
MLEMKTSKNQKLLCIICRQDQAKSQVPVAHTCNPSYSGGRDKEDCGSKPAWANSSQDPILKKAFPKKDWWSDSR